MRQSRRTVVMLKPREYSVTDRLNVKGGGITVLRITRPTDESLPSAYVDK